MGSITKTSLIEQKEKSSPMGKRISESASLTEDAEAIIGSNAFQTDQHDGDHLHFTLDISSENVLQGIIYSEILGSPVSRRKRR